MLKEETVERALREIRKGAAEYLYFFEHLPSPTWLEPLARHGYFKRPPPAIRQEQYISFPPWPESRCLVRMSAIPEAQATVLEIVLSIPETDNVWVHDDLVDIAMNLQPRQSVELVSRVCEWVQAPNKRLLPHKIGDLIVHLAEGGQSEAALTLASATLALGPDPRGTEEYDEESILWPEPRPKFQTFYYDRIVDRILPTLVVTTGLDAVRLFSDVLDRLIGLSRKKSDTGDEDFLYLPQSELESSKDTHDLRSIVLCAVRDAAEQLIRRDPSQFTAVIETLRTKYWVSFRRLELHLSSIFPEQGRWAAEEFFKNPDDLDRPNLCHEAVRLLESSFQALTAETQEKVLSWMDQGPPEDIVRRWLENFPQPITDDGVRAVSDEWRRDHFATLKGHMPELYERKLAELLARLGEGRPLGEPHRSSYGAFGPRSPRSVEELNEMGVDGILSVLGSWTPGTDMFSPTAEGLGSNLTTVVAQRPNDLATVADKFKGFDPTYVRSLLAGLTVALKQKLVFDWQPVLDLAVWVVNQPRGIRDRKGGLMVADPDWGWTRDAVIDLIKAGFSDMPGKLRCEDRPLVWQALRPLTDDPNPSLQDETGEHFDPATLSINSTRGRALYAVVKYAWWVRECAEAEGQPLSTFDAMPEVREVLDAHLDPHAEPTLTVRAVYGESIRSFAGIDWEWLQSNLNRILPDEEDDSPHFIAAWESFVTFTQPHPLLLPLLMSAYRRAVSRIGKPGLLRQPVSPESRLSEHLMIYYWWGKLDFDTDDGLLNMFFAVASGELRAHAMWFIKNFLGGSDDARPEAFERLRALMERRLAAANLAQSPDEFSQELAMFGYWFVSGKFEERWTLETLLSMLRLTKKTEGEMDVAKHLAELCPRHPVECIECLRLMIEGDRERWVMVSVEGTAREILRCGLSSNNSQAVLAARRLIQDLIALRYFEFRTLLG